MHDIQLPHLTDGPGQSGLLCARAHVLICVREAAERYTLPARCSRSGSHRNGARATPSGRRSDSASPRIDVAKVHPMSRKPVAATIEPHIRANPPLTYQQIETGDDG